jgi:asparagine synthase (glutamine-hydrolysing)
LDFIEVVSRGRELLYSAAMWEQLTDHCPFDDCNLQPSMMVNWHPLHHAAYLDYRVFLPGLLLSAKGDRSAMRWSVETRPPFLDEDVLDFCMRLHPSWKMRGWREKWLLRRVAERILPRRAAYRPKQGFRTTFALTFLSARRPEWVDQLLSPESLTATGYFDAQKVESIGRRHVRRVAWGQLDLTCDVALTAVVATQLWHHTFFGGLCDLATITEAKN